MQRSPARAYDPYSAPSEVGTFTIKATSKLDASRSATATAIVALTGGGNWGTGSGGGGTFSPRNYGVSVEPAMSRVDAGTYTALNATVLGSEDQGVTWSLNGGTTTASVDAQGVFTAREPGIYTVIATSKAKATAQGSAILIVESSVKGLQNVPAALDLEGYSVTVLKDGKILLVGGQDTRVTETDATRGYRATAFLYDPDTKAFTATGSLLQGRAGHMATLLGDGRVLISGGYGYFKWPTDPNASIQEQPVKWGEIYTPATGTFQALPVPPDHASYPAGSMRSAHGTTGQAVTLANGQVLMVGGPSGTQTTWPYDLFDPTTNLFDLSDIVTGKTEATYQTREGGAVVALDDGRALLTGGTRIYGLNETSPCGISRCAMAETRVYDPAFGTLNILGPSLTQARTGHTMTKLSNGKILILGGADGYTASGMTYLPRPTATAELYDPQTNSITPTGSMKWPRSGHAAILMPTGQVMVMGGFTSVTGDSTGTTWSYPTETELYDPDTGTFSVMDKLAFGLDRPKLAVMKDGGVFVGGKPIVTASAGTPAAATMAPGSKTVRPMIAPLASGDLGWLAGESAFGTVPPDTELNIEIENFISQQYVTLPMSTNVLDYFNPDFWIGPIASPVTFKGDNRGFTGIGDTRFRTYQHVKFDTKLVNRTNPIVEDPELKIGQSHQIFPVDRTATAPRSDLHVTGSIDPNTGEGIIEISGSSKIPLLQIAPGIDWYLKVTISKDGKFVRVKGFTDGFPSTSIYVYRNNLKIIKKIELLEPSGALGPMNLLPVIGDQDIDFTISP